MLTARTGLQGAWGVDSGLTEGLDPPHLSSLAGPRGLLECLLGRACPDRRVRCHSEMRQRANSCHTLSREESRTLSARISAKFSSRQRRSGLAGTLLCAAWSMMGEASVHRTLEGIREDGGPPLSWLEAA